MAQKISNQATLSLLADIRNICVANGKQIASLDKRVCALEKRVKTLEPVKSVAKPTNAKASSSTKKNTKKATTKKAVKGKGNAQPTVEKRLDKKGAINLMHAALQNRAASAYCRRLEKPIKVYKDLTDKQKKAITENDIKAGFASLYASDSWVRTSKRHALKKSDIKW